MLTARPPGWSAPQPDHPGAHQGGKLVGHEKVVVKVAVAGRWAHWHASCLACSWRGSERDSHAEALSDAEAHAYGEARVLEVGGYPRPVPAPVG